MMKITIAFIYYESTIYQALCFFLCTTVRELSSCWEQTSNQEFRGFEVRSQFRQTVSFRMTRKPIYQFYLNKPGGECGMVRMTNSKGYLSSRLCLCSRSLRTGPTQQSNLVGFYSKLRTIQQQVYMSPSFLPFPWGVKDLGNCQNLKENLELLFLKYGIGMGKRLLHDCCVALDNYCNFLSLSFFMYKLRSVL